MKTYCVDVIVPIIVDAPSEKEAQRQAVDMLLHDTNIKGKTSSVREITWIWSEEVDG